MFEAVAELAIRYGDLSEVQVEHVKRFAQANGSDFLSAIYDLGFLSEARCLELFRVSTGATVVCLADHHLDEMLALQIPESIARTFRVVPLHIFRSTLVVACSVLEPREFIKSFGAQTGLKLQVQFALDALIQKKLDELYPSFEIKDASGSMSYDRYKPDTLSVMGFSPESTKATHANASTVAILESETESLIDFEMSLSRLSVRTEVFGEANELLEFVHLNQVQVVILGTTATGMNALEVCRVLKESSETMMIPVVLVSRTIREREWQKHPRAQLANEFFVKPFDTMQMSNCVEKYLDFAPEWIDVSLLDESLGSSFNYVSAPTNDREEDLEAIIGNSEKAEDEGDYGNAEAWLERGVTKFASCFEIHQKQAEYFERRGYLHQASDVWQNAMMLDCSPEQASLAMKALQRLKRRHK